MENRKVLSFFYSESPSQGLKRKLGCIQLATQMGQNKRLESKYKHGAEIDQGRERPGEELAYKVLPKNGKETIHH
ncbi:hypothetical protein E2562_017728 [Oryza meyeriana var. granulata]|uniref:Uncharacterized protein n=1 Tax=Oryza meyeriana var. granulata TaxID=110450 RepID=A0A6G1BWR3_9ORYZ|nr:hypothetical protein E2562_017728 [Oryza meyeriana var. granulata]